MLASLVRPKKRREYVQSSTFRSPDPAEESRWPLLDGKTHETEGNSYKELRGQQENDGDAEEESLEDEDPDTEDEDAPVESTPLLPIFAPHLDNLPVYELTHAIRSLIVSRCETTLTWDQLRSPQISQFLVKPIQQTIKASHFSRATLYALMTNCLQFDREVHLNPGNSGTNHTRAMVSELLAIKLLRDYTTRELIDALSYDFYPLQGQKLEESENARRARGWGSAGGGKPRPGVARISCLEIAIRAQAKRFLSHALVVKHLEAIWAGTIVFHSAADSLHRSAPQTRMDKSPGFYGATPINGAPILSDTSGLSRRSVTLYDPRNASLFKLSRLRVPRYRQLLSTLSFAVLLGLFLAVLQERAVGINPLEIVFWFWSAGFMLDEIVGFNEQGFSLYLMSFWNVFDLGILILLFCYYCMRLYGAFMPSPHKQAVAENAYDILAANAVLLFPRLFSILDHYRYFSQLLIAFRIMASDLVAVFVLIIVACSGFFVAFTLSFSSGQDQSPGSVAYALFQMLMGFTPAAWTLWEEYNFLGRAILTMFLFICHFVVVTILITVLTNSFMRIVQNANQEHQFLFAVNTISMVKSDALFSYVAPTNILAWLITPLRYSVPFRQYLRLNRTIIKITHMPILFTICLYEKTILSPQMIESTDLVDSPLRSQFGGETRVRHRFRVLSSGAPRFVREPSVATFQKDRALEEVFRPPFKRNNHGTPAREILQRKSNNLVSHWMQEMGSGPANPPDEQDSDEVDRLERVRRGRFPFQRGQTRSLRNFTDSVASNTEDPTPQAISSPVTPRDGRGFVPRRRRLSHYTGIEGDNELTSDDNGDWHAQESSNNDSDGGSNPSNGARGKVTPKFYSSRPSTAKRKSRKNSPARFARNHSRNPSGATILYNPVLSSRDGESDAVSNPIPTAPRIMPSQQFSMPPVNRQTLERRHSMDSGRALNGLTFRSNPMSVPNIGNFLAPSHSSWHHETSMLEGVGSDLGDGKAIADGFVGGAPSSFTSQMVYATGGIRRRGSPHRNQDMLSKLVLARMNNIEEGFREVIKEVKDLRSSRSRSRPDEQRTGQRDKRRADKKKRHPESRKGKTSEETRFKEPTLASSKQSSDTGSANYL
ncbi:ion transporter [Aspergillus lucknowensis]|uniref:Ion transport domain-containing protein n=1 Tax=Aspergillus lucknowensis TaxID=176173 RepID=A0ABR4LXF6_9EURO